MATVEIGSRSSAHGAMKEVFRNGPKLMEDSKRNATEAASACLGRRVGARIESGGVLGASGGLMFALALVDELMRVAGVQDLSHALTVLTGAGCRAHAPRA